jgi:hypothetical protein
MVVKRRTVTELPMPEDIITKVSEWGRKTLKEQFHHKLEFLNRMKQKYDWDGDEAEMDEGLVDPDLDANTPGVLFTNDTSANSTEDGGTPDDDEVANTAIAAANANLTPTHEAEITGVDLPTPSPVTDDEGNTSDDDEDIIEAGAIAPPAPQVQQLHTDDEFEPNNDPPLLETANDSDD